MKWSLGDIVPEGGSMNVFFKRVLMASVAVMVVDCAAVVPRNVSQEQVYQQDELPKTGIVLTLRDQDLQTAVFITADVAKVVGTEVFESFVQRGWRQITDAERNSQQTVDIICLLGMDDSGSQVAARCHMPGVVQVNGYEEPIPVSIGALSLQRDVVQRIGWSRVRNAIVDLVLTQRNDTISSAQSKIAELRKR